MNYTVNNFLCHRGRAQVSLQYVDYIASFFFVAICHLFVTATDYPSLSLVSSH